jgi:hypothetical protein
MAHRTELGDVCQWGVLWLNIAADPIIPLARLDQEQTGKKGAAVRGHGWALLCS